MTDNILSNNTYFIIFLSFHILISIAIGFSLSRYVKKRFVTNSYKTSKQDIKRLQEIINENSFYKVLFRSSLHKNNLKTSFAYFFLFNLSMPLLGYIASIVLARMMVNVKYNETISNTNILNLDEFGISFLEVERVFGEGSLNDLIHSQYAPKSKKLRALNVLSTNISPANLRIIKQTLSSTDDEIRMFGYAIIDKAEKRLSKNINVELEHLRKATEKNHTLKIAISSEKLAFLYWELLYTELSHDSLNNEFLNQVEHYALLARRHYLIALYEVDFNDSQSKQNYINNLSKIHLLLGKVFMRKELYDKSLTELIISQELREDDANFVLPYIAEVYFLMGKYKIVSSILSRLQTLNINVTIYPILKQWKRA